MIPQDIGYAWALKQQGKDEIVVMCHGDGGCSEGSVYEGLEPCRFVQGSHCPCH